MRILFDTNVLLDALLERRYAEEAYYLIDQALEGPVEGTVTPTILINTYYVGRKEVGDDSATRFIRELLQDLDVLFVSGDMFRHAIRSFDDFEDGAIGAAAEASEVDFICTRNDSDFEPSRVPALAPQAVIEILQG